MDGELKYWHNGEPILPDDSSDIKELKYWLNGVPYVYTAQAEVPPVTDTGNFFQFI